MSLRSCQKAFSLMRQNGPSRIAKAASARSAGASNLWNASAFVPISNDDRQRRHLQTDVHVKPSVDIAKLMPVGMSEMSNETLVTIAAMGNHKARCEVLIRHIMSVDEVDYDEATQKSQEIAAANRKAAGVSVYPYFIGISLAMISAFGSLPMVFDLNTALWFNSDFVTTDVPEPADLETMLEVGSWTWNWMEPPLGALSFSLLCLQYGRAQLENLGLHPYTYQVINRRADKLAAAYPQYDPIIIRSFSKSDPLVKTGN